MAQSRIIVVGSANVDLVVAADRLPTLGETIMGEKFQTFSGGKGANQAVAAARAGGNVAMIGRVGSDAFGARLEADLAASGVDVSEFKNTDDPTGVALIVTTTSGDNAIVVAPGANQRVDAAAIDEAMRHFPHATHILAQLEIPLEGVLRAAEASKRIGATFILDPAPAQALPAELLALTDWITPNETEASHLLGSGSELLEPFEKARAIQSLGARNVILKMSHRGSVVLTGGLPPAHIAPFMVTAVDSTAAGDAFNGAFAVALADGHNPVQAAEFASAAAGISVTRRGAQASMPTRGEIDAMMQFRSVSA
jgi:ribokinase